MQNNILSERNLFSDLILWRNLLNHQKEAHYILYTDHKHANKFGTKYFMLTIENMGTVQNSEDMSDNLELEYTK
jgi:hypothetical protein